MNSQAHPNLERSFQDSKPQDRSNNNTFLIVIAVKLFFAWLSPDKGEGGGGEERSWKHRDLNSSLPLSTMLFKSAMLPYKNIWNKSNFVYVAFDSTFDVSSQELLVIRKKTTWSL